MSDKSLIEWTDATWNPITGCSVVSPGCTNCYAMRLAGTRLKHHPTREGLTVASKAGPVWNGEVRFNEQALGQPLHWPRPRRIFVCAHGDLFAEQVPEAWIDRVFAVMALCPQHTFQVLTKHPARMRAYLSDSDVVIGDNAAVARIYGVAGRIILIAPGMDETGAPPEPRVHLGTWPLSNVWLGTSVEDQTRADERIPELLATPAALRFISAEPLLGPIDILPYLFIYTHADDAALDAPTLEPLPFHDPATTDPADIATPRLDWVIVGGESGPGARPMHPDWARSLRDQCAAAGVAYFFKQWGEWLPTSDDDGQISYGRHDPHGWNLDTQDEAWSYCVGKKAAGRLLDGVEHNAMPEPRR